MESNDTSTQSPTRRAFRVDSNSTLNDGIAAPPGKADPAAQLKSTLNALKAQVYDAQTQRFDYSRARASECYRELRACTTELIGFDTATLWRREERLAFWINLYNVLVIDAVIQFEVRGSVTNDRGFFRRAAYCVGGMRFSADDIEHGILRGNRRHPALFFPQFGNDDPRLKCAIRWIDPRIHAALNCASRSCPPIAVYAADRLHAQLDQAMQTFINDTTSVACENGVMLVSPIFLWYRGDFGGRPGILDWVTHNLSDTGARQWLTANGNQVRIKYSRYNWGLDGGADGAI